MNAVTGGAFATYQPQPSWCELTRGPIAASAHGQAIVRRFAAVPLEELRSRARDARTSSSTRASPSPSTATATRPSGSCRST